MHHIGTITEPKKAIGRPFFVSCSCGVQGDFKTLDAAIGWLNGHFRGLSSYNTHEMVNKVPVAPVNPKKTVEVVKDKAPDNPIPPVVPPGKSGT